MSDRGSFVTSWMYCPDCREVLAKLPWESHDFWPYELVDSEPAADTWGGGCIPTKAPPIVAGIWKGDIDFYHVGLLCGIAAPRLCHPVKLAIIPEEEHLARFFDLKR